MLSEILRAPRRLPFALFFIAAAATANAQCYQFSGSGVSLQINISAINVWIGPTSLSGGSFISNGFFSSNNTFVAGGITLTSQAISDGAASIDYTAAVGANPAFTTLHIIVPTNQSDTLSASYSWQITLFGGGNLIPSGTLPQTLPPISAWVYQTAEEVIGVLSGPISDPTSTLYTITSVTSCSASSSSGSSVSGKGLGDSSDNPGGCNCGNPINIGNGNKYETAVDYKTAGPNTLGFTRYYNSLAASSTFAATLGANWRSNYDRYLGLVSPTSVTAERADGQQLTFTLTGSIWTPDTDVDVTLTNTGSTWTLTDHNDTVETYLALGANEALLQSIQIRNGYIQVLTYNSTSQLTTVTDSFQRALNITYNGNLLESVTTPDSLVLTYGYSAGNLTSVGYSTSPPTTVTYLYKNAALPSALTGIIDENGNRYATWTYDSTGRGLTSQHASGADLTTVAYDDTDGSRTVTGPLGQQGVYHFTMLQNIPKLTEIDFPATSTTAAAKTTYTYDGNGYRASITDWNGNLINFVNNIHGMPTSIVEAAGTSLARTTTITYHPTFRLPVQIVRPSATAGFTYDNNGEMLTATVTDTTTGTAPYSTSGHVRTWTFTWANFLLASAKGPRTDVSALTKFMYDASGALTGITNALNQTTQITQHLPGGPPLIIVNPNGVNTTLTYDARQRLLTNTVATAAGPLTSKLAYDAAGNLITITLPDGSSDNNTYDAAHRLTGIADLLHQSVNYTLNPVGRITGMAVNDAAGKTQLQRSGVYDALGRAIQTIGGAGQTTSYGYDANSNLTAITDGLNHTRRQSFDALNRLLQSTDAAQGVTVVSYDPLSHPASITDPSGNITRYIFDGFGDLIEEVSPTSGTTVYRYDASGNLVQCLDARGVVANYAYDALNRLISITYPGGSVENLTLTYDQNQFGAGRLTSVADAAGTLMRSYDERGNVLTETRAQGGTTLATAYAYDTASRIASITYPSHWSVTFTRDTMGRVISAAASSGTGSSRALFSGVGYQPFGPINAVTYGNGIAETRAFDADYRLTGMSAAVQNLSYGYDAADNVLSIADGIHAANTQGLAYDALNRLTSASGAYGKLGYTYDANGNRLTETSTATSDGLGSVTSFAYNQSGRLAAAYGRDQQLTQYTYDAFGRRLMKNGSITGTTRYQYGTDGALLEEADGQGNAQVDYVYLNHRPVAAIEGDATLNFLHDDRLGAPQLATSSSQSVVWSTTYQPFGQIANAPTLIANDLRLPGQEADAETGLYHNGFRDYAPGLGRYVQSDPAGLAAGTNRYAYADSNPAGEIDPSGLAPSLLEQASSAWQQAAAPCQAFGNCSTWTQAKIAWNLATSQQTPYVPTLPSDMGPPAPAPTENLIPLMECAGGFAGCTPAAMAQVYAAQTAAGWAQIANYNSTLYSQVLVPTLQSTLEYSELALTLSAGAPQWGVPALGEAPEGLESLVSAANLIFNNQEASGLFPSGNVPGMPGFNLPFGTGLGTLGVIGAKDIAQGLQICPITGQVIGGN